MGDKSKIEWTEASWTPIRARNKATGKIGWHCEHATPGCENCYSESLNKRLGTQLQFKPGHRKDIEIFLDEKMLTQPLRWKRGRMIFVCSMTDLFADFVPDEWIDKIFAVMGLAAGHTFQVLTKRPERMQRYMSYRFGQTSVICDAACEMDNVDMVWASTLAYQMHDAGYFRNVWLGVSAEDQKRADERIPHLLATPTAVRFVSAEPLLGPIDFAKIDAPDQDDEYVGWKFDCLQTGDYYWFDDDRGHKGGGDGPYRDSRLDWIIVGGESGPNARPMHPDWARSIRDQCQAAGVPYFFKQWGEHVTGYLDREDFHVDEEAHGPNVTWNGTARCFDIPGESGHYGRVGKRAAGRLLDGREHNEMPERAK